MDKLEKHILDNREGLDRHIPDPKIWTHIQESNPAKIFKISPVMRYVAAALILIGSALIYLNLSNSSANALSTPELLESELYYAGKVESLIDKAQPIFTSNPGLKDEMMLEISSLDSIYADLKKDLKDNVSNDEVIEALILNYRVKIGILEEMLEILGDDKHNDEKKISHEL